MKVWPHQLETDEVMWLRDQRRARTQLRGVYVALTQAINIERALKGKPLTSKAAVFAAVVGYTFKHLEVPPATTNQHYRPSKLTRKQVREIVRLLDQKDPVIPTEEIAKRYGVSQVCISKINTRSIHPWATKGQSRLHRSRHHGVTLDKEDHLCLLRCAADREWWRKDVLAEIFGLTSANCVSHRLRSAKRKHQRIQEQRRGSMIPVNGNSRA
jgi:hypothetical protein